MTPPRIFTPHNALADRLHDRRGIDAKTAIRQAQSEIVRIEPEALAEVDRVLALLAQDLNAYRERQAETFVAQAARLYAAADVVAGLALAVRRPKLGEAASNLCKLLSEDGLERPEAIAVHIEAMMLIRRDDAAGAAVLQGLHRLTASASAPDPTTAPVETATNRSDQDTSRRLGENA